ncbi:MAG: BamA/TamA family outer membrane protein, partial [Chitinivibrionales bacterium]|nr:BamA/TamA family outer membrane protein [Chitinivibrionales bacterium]
VWGVDAVIRGYDEFSIGAQGTFGSRRTYEKGKVLFSFNSELRVPVVEQTLYFALFGDMGNTWSNVADLDLSDLYRGAGFGVRLMVPMLGLLGLDFGWPVDKLNAEGHFSGSGWGKVHPHIIMNRGF